MAFSDTLLVRRLPVCLSKIEIEDLLKHIGAIRVAVFESNIKKQTAFATNKDVAGEALFRLHQKEIFGSRLVVEFAQNNESSSSDKNTETEIKNNEDEKKSKLYESFLQNLNNWTVGLNFTLPPPYHLRYRYPPPSAEVLINIINMLSCTTKFYTQVLHLMNKMNLPCPFEPEFPLQENEIFNSFIIYILENSVYEGKENEKTSVLSSSENDTELESDEDEKIKVLPKKRKLLEKKSIKKRKLFKPMTSITTKSSKISSVDEVFEKIEREIPTKKIEVKIPSEISLPSITSSAEQKSENTDGFGVIYPVEKIIDTECRKKEEDAVEKYISSEELATNRPGISSCRLYVKNLSKDVVLSDLHYIFKRYFIKGIDEQGTMFDIRLMQEGRMKGQAFITLQNIKQAELALKETNGFIIKGKPMVVQYARSALAKSSSS
ncbi:hypothetical protein PGB90_005828 [Kerria lacca]